jgi:hypothetical protein
MGLESARGVPQVFHFKGDPSGSAHIPKLGLALLEVGGDGFDLVG